MNVRYRQSKDKMLEYLFFILKKKEKEIIWNMFFYQLEQREGELHSVNQQIGDVEQAIKGKEVEMQEMTNDMEAQIRFYEEMSKALQSEVHIFFSFYIYFYISIYLFLSYYLIPKKRACRFEAYI